MQSELYTLFSGSTTKSLSREEAILQTIPKTVKTVALSSDRRVIPVKLRIVPATQLSDSAICSLRDIAIRLSKALVISRGLKFKINRKGKESPFWYKVRSRPLHLCASTTCLM